MSPQPNHGSGMLAGIEMLDLTSVVLGASCTRIFADQVPSEVDQLFAVGVAAEAPREWR